MLLRESNFQVERFDFVSTTTEQSSGAEKPAVIVEVPTPRKKSVIPGGTLYRGREGMWSWVLHRITGIGLYFFLLVHILDTALVRVSPEAYNAVIGAYQTPLMGVAEIGLVAAVVFHAFNGLRIILVDFWNIGTKHHKAIFYVVIGMWVITMLAFTPRHLANVFGW
jgi:succinate dehydrogenase / fumarate reductase cytochrome b subunit